MNVYIIGAGPSGLITALELVKKGYNVIIFEKSTLPGGMCRTWKESHYLLDTGPHIYHTPDKEMEIQWKNDFKDILIEGEFWSKNVIDGDLSNLIDYPLSWEAINNFEKSIQNKIKEELSTRDQSKSIGAKNFNEYVENLVGPTITKMFFTKYPKKVWGESTSNLTADWAPKRIEIREKITPFYFGQYAAVGKYGTGSVYNNIAEKFISLGGKIIYETELIQVNFKDDTIKCLGFSNGSKIDLYENDIVISTIPITILGRLLGVDSSLNFRGIASVYLSIDSDKINWPKGVNWLYFDSEKYDFNRITNSSSLSPFVAPSNETLITVETTYTKGDDFDKLSKTELEKLITNQVIKSGITIQDNINFFSSNKEPFVYPLQYPGFQMELAKVKSKIESFHNLYSIGTGGDFNYADSQVIFNKAYDLVQIISDVESKTNQVKKNNSILEFNQIVKIKEFSIGCEKCNPIIIGEIGLNHNGNYDLAIKLIDEAVDCGLKFVKLQTFTSGNSRVSNKVKSANYIEKITDQEETISAMFDKFNLTLDNQVSLFNYARNKGLIIFSTPFDIESAIFLDKTLQVDCFKIASVDLVNLPLISIVASFNKPIILSCGMSKLSEIEDALEVISNAGNPNVILLHCNSSYPAPIEEMNLNVINTLKKAFKVPVGLSDHTFGLFASTISMSIGASVIERHFTLDRFMEGPDHILSSEPNEMRELVENSILIMKSLGNGIKKIQNGEYFNINLQRKCLYANRNLIKGDIIKLEDLVVKGPGGGILPKYINVIIGRTINLNIEKDHPITWKSI